MDFIAQYIPLVLSLLAVGAFGGFLAGLLGIGGGLVFVPGLYYVLTALGYDPAVMMHVAIGTSMAMIIVTGARSARGHWKKGAVDMRVAGGLGAGMLIGVALGTVIADYISGELLKAVFAVALAGMAFIMFFDPARYHLRKDVPRQPFLSAFGVVFGILSTLMGIGGGMMNVPFLSLCRVPVHTAVGTASMLGFVISVPAAIGYIWIGLDVAGRPPLSLGFVNMLAWAVIAPSSIWAVPFGVRAAHAVSVTRLRRIFAIFMVFIALRMIYEYAI